LPNEPIQVVADTGPQYCDRGMVLEDDPEEGEKQDHDVTINFGEPRLSGFEEECQALALNRVDCGLYSAVAEQDGVPVPGSKILSGSVSGGAPGVALKVPRDGGVDLVDGSLKASSDLAAADSVVRTSNDGLKLNASSPQCFDPAAVDLVLDDGTSNENNSLKPRYEFSNTVDDDFAFLPEALRTQTINFSIQSAPFNARKKLLPLLFRIAMFLPWCVSVGGTIVMYPSNLSPFLR
jgi:hypothetical protein